MGRLIDADELLAQIRQIDFLKIPNSTKLSACEIIEIVNRQPTAYDVEKVVEELEEIKQDWKMKEQERGLNFMDCVILREYQKHYDKAIDIVRKGGVE